MESAAAYTLHEVSRAPANLPLGSWAYFSAGIDNRAGVRVQGPGIRPKLGFACCDGDLAQARALIDDSAVIGTLRDLDAEVALPTLDFSPERADLVRMLNRKDVTAIAWLTLSKADGLYMNADNEAQAEERVRAFEEWTRSNGLRWAAVGLDIEPNFAQLGTLKQHKWRLMRTLLGRAFDGGRIKRAQQEYSSLIRRLQEQGYVVQTYQMPYVPAERDAHSTVLDGVLGTVDVRGNEEYLMLYTSFAPQVDAGMIWSLGRNAQGIAVGSTDAAAGAGALSWEELSRDLIVASHFTRRVGVYNLEGCVRQGWLPRMKSFDWGQTVMIPESSIARAERMGRLLRVTLWLISHIVYLVVGMLVAVVWLASSRQLTASADKARKGQESRDRTA